MATLMIIPWLWLWAVCVSFRFADSLRFVVVGSLSFWWGNDTLFDHLVVWEALRVSIIFSDHPGSAFPSEVLHRWLSLGAAHQAFLRHGQSISAVPTSALHPCPLQEFCVEQYHSFVDSQLSVKPDLTSIPEFHTECPKTSGTFSYSACIFLSFGKLKRNVLRSYHPKSLLNIAAEYVIKDMII